jgi:NitT/TauT family transport system substrate-binding protein
MIRRQFLASAAASAAAPTIVCAQAPAPALRVGCAAVDQYGEPRYALDAGFFQKAGLDVEVTNFPQGAVAATAVVGGSLDIGGTTPLVLANAIQRSVPLVVIAISAFSTPKCPPSLVCVAANGPLRSAKDLVGKTVGVNALQSFEHVIRRPRTALMG